MSNAYVGEIRMFGGNFAPAGWAFCNGQTLAISENDVLFNLIGTTYGGDGQENFKLPDLQGRLPLHMGQSKQGGGIAYQIGENGGVETVTLSVQQIPIHTHAMVASTGAGTQNAPNNSVTAASPSVTLYTGDVTDSNLSPNAVGPAGGSQPHDNFQPYLCINFIMSLFGIYPTPN